MNDLQNEWAIIHLDIEKYERFSLLIKLFSILISVIALAYHINAWIAVIFMLILWLLDGIWTTFQNRMQTRILFIEQGMRQESENNPQAYQLYSQWTEKRQSGVSAIKEYILNSARPTVAYPYAVLITLMLIAYQFTQ